MVSIEDRGFQFGDGVYEVVVSYDGRLFLLDQHLARLQRSASAIGLTYDFVGKPLKPVIHEGLQRADLSEAMVYIQLSRGVAPRVHDIPEGLTPTVVLTFKPRVEIPADLRSSGVSVVTVPESRWAKCYIKAITLLPNVLARTEAKRQGYFDAVFVTQSGEVREGSGSNIFTVKNGRLRIPPRDESVLHGITQNFIMDCAESLGISVEELGVSIEDLRGADEVFLSGTTYEVLSVTSVDGGRIGDGKVGAVTKSLQEEFVRRSRGGQ